MKEKEEEEKKKDNTLGTGQKQKIYTIYICVDKYIQILT